MGTLATVAGTTSKLLSSPEAMAARLEPATREFLKALASPVRQEIMMLFGGGAELSVNEVAELAGVSQSNASQQLTILRRGGIVTARRDGKLIIYRADRDSTSAALSDLQRYLATCC